MVIVETVCVVVVVQAICSPELAVERDDSENRGGGIGSDEVWSSYGGGPLLEDCEGIGDLSGSSKVTRLIRIDELFLLKPSLKRREEKELRDEEAPDSEAGLLAATPSCSFDLYGDGFRSEIGS